MNTMAGNLAAYTLARVNSIMAHDSLLTKQNRKAALGKSRFIFLQNERT